MAEGKKVKCLIWDLDNTLWDGTLLENSDVSLYPGVDEILRELDRRGILLSVASKNETKPAMAKLEELGLAELFLYPQINWNSKAQSVAAIAKALNLGLDSFAFIDDQPFERDDVHMAHPMVRVYDAAQRDSLLELPELMPRFVTEDSRLRREMYRSDLARKEDEAAYTGSSEEFLATLGMELTIAPVARGDLERVEELTLRTNQLNSTGYTYDFDELSAFMTSPQHTFLIASLSDRYGSYGKIGLMLLEETEDALELKLLLMSCRVMTRGIGSALLIHALKLAERAGKPLRAQFVDTGRNRVMYITYKLMGFEEIREDGDWSLLEYQGEQERDYPEYLKVDIR